MRTDVDPKVDVVFKRLFGNEDEARLLVSLINAVIEPAAPVAGLHIVLPTSDKTSILEKEVIADVKARDDGNRQFHLEMQWQVPAAFRKRMLFYWAKFHPQQLREGENYMTLRPTITICFLDRILFPETDRYHLLFEVRERQQGMVFCEDLQIHLIELPKFKKRVEELTNALDRWLYFLRHGAELDVDALTPSLDVPEIRRALEVITMFTQEERDRELYELRKKVQLDAVFFPEAFRLEIREEERKVGRDAGLKEGLKEGRDAGLKEGLKEGRDAGLKEGRDAGIKEGLKEGREEGLQKGEVVGRIHLSQRLLKQAPTPREDLLKLSLDELMRLAETLEQQLLSSTNGTP